jgi:hypothetical protein
MIVIAGDKGRRHNSSQPPASKTVMK